MGKTICKTPLLPGSMLNIGGKEVEVDSMISREDFYAGRPFIGAVGKPTLQELDESLRINVKFNAKIVVPKVTTKVKNDENDDVDRSVRIVASKSQSTKSHFRNPLKNSNIMPKPTDHKPTPRHDPNSPGALVMRKPVQVPQGKQIVDVVVDPILCKHLREHQREGVKFMYECVMGMRPYKGEGAILADEMGLGKTLQVIALLWTLLKQNPIHEAEPVIKKALIVCPVTLIKNWRKEFRKWLGNERIGVFDVEDTKRKLTDFTMGKSYSVMIMGYERLRTVQADLQKGSGIDIVIADEGHRLKTAANKSAQAIKALSTDKRIILSGTPLQNDLSEFYFMVDFVNPGLLGKANSFKREFETPMLKSRQPEASLKDIEKGEARSRALAELTGLFILRRTAEVISKYLPRKNEYILFCKPTTTQSAIYRKVLASPAFNAVLGSPEASLQLINVLKKLCNSPNLLKEQHASNENSSNSIISSLLSSIPSSLLNSPGASGKLQVLDSILHSLRTTTQEKAVLVSHYTATLDILGSLLTSLSYPWLRLDGSTPAAKRQDLVDTFNRTDAATYFAFLLSAKAGGAGINLIGASRLILFDIDWNPSTDLQAMARIHRDGQKRPCKIYRLLTQGALDEKIYQRQLTKLSLADSVIDNKASAATFTKEELRNLFALDESVKCQTHELLGCPCAGRARELNISPTANEWNDIDDLVDDDNECDEMPSLSQLVKASKVDMVSQEQRIKDQARHTKTKSGNKPSTSALMQYQHIDTSGFADLQDEEMEAMIGDDVLRDVLKDTEHRISFTFAKSSG